MRFHSSDKSYAGFTLLEVVVAMAIVGLGVVTVLETFSLGLRLTGRSSERTEATMQGQRVMDELLARRDLAEGREEGSFDEYHRWKVQIAPVTEQPLSQSTGGWVLREVTVEMRYREREREREMTLKTLRLVKKAP
jgi:general secretion pathway protein I